VFLKVIFGFYTGLGAILGAYFIILCCYFSFANFVAILGGNLHFLAYDLFNAWDILSSILFFGSGFSLANSTWLENSYVVIEFTYISLPGETCLALPFRRDFAPDFLKRSYPSFSCY